MANSNPYLILRRCRDSVILQLRQLFAPENNTAVTPSFEYNYIESSATGFIQFYGNPSNGNTFTIGINTITFVTGAPSGLQVQIGLTQQITLSNLVALINANSSTLLVTATTNSIPGKADLKANATGAIGNQITLSIVSTVLRVSGPTLTQGGLWDFDTSEIFIGDAIPQDYQDWPMIIVDTASASESRYLGPEDSFQAKNSFGVVTKDEIFSSLVVNVNIKVYIIDDTLARDNIIDLIYNNISEIRDQLAVNGIEMIDRTLPTETRVFQDQRQYITNHFILRVYCEWSDNLDITNISGINLTVPVNVNKAPVITSPIFASGPEQILFNIISVDSGTALTVDNTVGMTDGDELVQGSSHTLITSIVDSTHLLVSSTVGFVGGVAISLVLPFTYQIIASNNPTIYGATGLPTGLTINTGTGLISGTPTVAGTSYVSLSATNSVGTTTSPLTLTIKLS